MPMALLKRRIKAWELLINWIVVFFGNLAGALCYVAFMGECKGNCSRSRPNVQGTTRTCTTRTR